MRLRAPGAQINTRSGELEALVFGRVEDVDYRRGGHHASATLNGRSTAAGVRPVQGIRDRFRAISTFVQTCDYDTQAS